MRYKLQKLGCYFLIIVLLPYIVTVFMNGPFVVSQTNVVENVIVKVAVSDGVQNLMDEDLENQRRQESEIDYVEVPMENLVIGILACEIPADYESEAIQAQAVIVRTRIYKELQEKGSDAVLEEEFMTEEEMKDAWGVVKFPAYYNKLESAWHQTEGQVLMYEDKLIYAPFFKLSNGNTRDGEEVLGKEYPYLKIKECPLDIEEAEQLQTTIIDMETDIKAKSLDSAGYVLKVQVGEDEVNGEEFRKNYNLASSCFSVHEYEGEIRITTRGVGHGIGLSQNTANKMAESGKNTEDILKYFYEGCEIKEVADIVKEIE